MRPDLLTPLFASVEGLKGIGPSLAKPLDRLGLKRLRDLAYHLPDRFVQRRPVATLDEAGIGEQIVIPLTARDYRSAAGRGPFRVMAEDAAGDYVALTWFGRNAGWAKKSLPLGERRWIAGRLDQFGQTRQIVHPDHIGEDARRADPAVRAGLSAVRGADPGAAAGARGAGARRRARTARMDRAGPGGPRALAGVARRAGAGAQGASTRRRAIGWPTTNCWPTSLR